MTYIVGHKIISLLLLSFSNLVNLICGIFTLVQIESSSELIENSIGGHRTHPITSSGRFCLLNKSLYNHYSLIQISLEISNSRKFLSRKSLSQNDADLCENFWLARPSPWRWRASTPSTTWRLRSRTRKASHPISSDWSSPESNWRTAVLSLITMFGRSPLFTSFCDSAEACRSSSFSNRKDDHVGGGELQHHR